MIVGVSFRYAKKKRKKKQQTTTREIYPKLRKYRKSSIRNELFGFTNRTHTQAYTHTFCYAYPHRKHFASNCLRLLFSFSTFKVIYNWNFRFTFIVCVSIAACIQCCAQPPTSVIFIQLFSGEIKREKKNNNKQMENTFVKNTATTITRTRNKKKKRNCHQSFWQFIHSESRKQLEWHSKWKYFRA